MVLNVKYESRVVMDLNLERRARMDSFNVWQSYGTVRDLRVIFRSAVIKRCLGEDRV